MCASDLARWISRICGVTAARGRLNGRASTPRKAPREARKRGRVWKPHDHRRAAAAPLESCHMVMYAKEQQQGMQTGGFGDELKHGIEENDTSMMAIGDAGGGGDAAGSR